MRALANVLSEQVFHLQRESNKSTDDSGLIGIKKIFCTIAKYYLIFKVKTEFVIVLQVEHIISRHRMRKNIELLTYLEVFSFFFFLLGGRGGFLLLHLLRGGRQQESLPHSEIANIYNQCDLLTIETIGHRYVHE